MEEACGSCSGVIPQTGGKEHTFIVVRSFFLKRSVIQLLTVVSNPKSIDLCISWETLSSVNLKSFTGYDLKDFQD